MVKLVGETRVPWIGFESVFIESKGPVSLYSEAVPVDFICVGVGFDD